MNPDIKEASGACHCGTVRFRVKLSDAFIAHGAAPAPIAGCVVRWPCQPILMGWRSLKVKTH